MDTLTVHSLKAMAEHRSVRFLENVVADLDRVVVRSNAKNIGIERGEEEFRGRYTDLAIGLDWLWPGLVQ